MNEALHISNMPALEAQLAAATAATAAEGLWDDPQACNSTASLAEVTTFGAQFGAVRSGSAGKGIAGINPKATVAGSAREGGDRMRIHRAFEPISSTMWPTGCGSGDGARGGGEGTGGPHGGL